MAQLKDPQKAIPGGYDFYQPQTKWHPAPFSSLDSITGQLIAHRRGRPDLIASCGWSTDPAVVLNEVKQFNVAKCQQMGWTDYISGGGVDQPPFSDPQPQPVLQRLRNVVGGSTTLVEWANEGAPTVAPDLANHRAEVCVKCPMNGQGGWEAYFTVPVSNAIRTQLERKRNMKLETTHDDKLGVCEGCTCPLPLKVWLPIENIVGKMPQAQFDALHSDCWIRSEKK